MGLYFLSGPSWEEDSLNDINETSLLSNAKDMLTERRNYLKEFLDNNTGERRTHSRGYFPNTHSVKVGKYRDYSFPHNIFKKKSRIFGSFFLIRGLDGKDRKKCIEDGMPSGGTGYRVFCS